MKIFKPKLVKTTKKKDYYSVNVKLRSGELYKLFPIDDNLCSNAIIDALSDKLQKKFDKIYNNFNWYDSWAIENKEDVVKLSFKLEIYKD